MGSINEPDAVAKHGVFELRYPGETFGAECVWDFKALDNIASTANFHSVDITISRLNSKENTDLQTKIVYLDSPSSNGDDLDRIRDIPSLLFFLEAIEQVAKKQDNVKTVIRLLFPVRKSYVLWSDFFEARMSDCDIIQKKFGCFGLSEPLGPIEFFESQRSLLDLVTQASAELVVVGSSTSELTNKLALLDKELIKRFSFPWWSCEPVIAKKLALVEGGFNLDFRQRILQDAKALGIELTILDRPGHWLQSEKYAYLRSAFLPLDTTLDEGLPQRIVTLLRDTGTTFDGITTFSDNYLVATATAAEALKLPTAPHTSLANVVDKFECRRRVTKGSDIFCFTDLSDLQHQLGKNLSDLTYPLIVKPSRGGGSQGVTKVNTPSALPLAIENVIGKFKEKVLLEPYIDGPEIDVNYVLCDGEILFCEISDNLPCAGDDTKATALDSFLETGIIFPSALDEDVQNMVRSSLHQNLLELGFTTGIFHVEARVCNSGMSYKIGEDGLLDLRHDPSLTKANPSVFLLEINARCPGRQALCGVARTYGIDYYTMQLLFAVDEKIRAKALCHSFQGGQQFFCEAVYIPASRGGIYDSDDLYEDLCKRQPDLAAAIIEYHCLFQKGEMVPAPESGKLRWIATFLVSSTKARSSARMLAQRLKEEVKYKLIGDS
ncbi:hypothetical protein BP6252_11271 [Coleophoma cylindrospora]|uniref:ATP-grasp domain-containing protein n=1 Tax=Coleophoma cylindrospora TaxID=1849047 RepID=A0A3D8QPH0_9HELO|nr:hypothetical protein BP6252_11271 [Coleophoma cylindrospora]